MGFGVSLDVFGEKYRVSACAAIERTDEGKIYKIDDDKNITEAAANEVSNTFRTITAILESSNTTIDEFGINVVAGNSGDFKILTHP